MKVTLPPGTLALAVPNSQNAKIGNAATTYAAQGSCPSGCVFFDGGGCYAESGPVGKFVTTPLNAAAGTASALAIARAEALAIDAMEVEPGKPMRLHTVGDCATPEAASVVSAAAERYMARGGGQVWTYTHGWREVERECWGKVSVLASCETGHDVRLARSRGYATALVVEEFAADRRYEIGPAEEGAGDLLAASAHYGEEGTSETQSQRSRVGGSDSTRGGDANGTGARGGHRRHPEEGATEADHSARDVAPGRADGNEQTETVGSRSAGLSVLPCPAQTRDVPCSDCRLCFDDAGLRERGYSIGFEVHGIPFAKRQARIALARPNDPLRRVPSEQRIREIRERVLAAENREVTVREVSAEIPDLARASVYEWLRYLRGEIEHPAERRRKARAARRIADRLHEEAVSAGAA